MRRPLRILVLESSQISRKILEVILGRAGHLVVGFGDPVEALRFQAQREPADLLFLGVELPKMDGFEVLKHVRREPRFRSTVLVVLLADRDGVLDRIKARLAGAQHVVAKPLVRQQITALVSSHLIPEGGGPEGGSPRGAAGLWIAGKRKGER